MLSKLTILKEDMRRFRPFHRASFSSVCSHSSYFSDRVLGMLVGFLFRMPERRVASSFCLLLHLLRWSCLFVASTGVQPVEAIQLQPSFRDCLTAWPCPFRDGFSSFCCQQLDARKLLLPLQNAFPTTSPATTMTASHSGAVSRLLSLSVFSFLPILLLFICHYCPSFLKGDWPSKRCTGIARLCHAKMMKSTVSLVAGLHAVSTAGSGLQQSEQSPKPSHIFPAFWYEQANGIKQKGR